MQLTHDTTKFQTKQFNIILVCDSITNAANVGSLFRIADAFGIQELIFCGKHFSLGRRFKKTSRATENVVQFRIETNIISVLKSLKEKDYTILGLEITSKSIPISNFKIGKTPIALVLGNEIDGISDSVLELLEETFHITMYGQNSSMNVSQATGIVLFHITNSILKLDNK